MTTRAFTPDMLSVSGLGDGSDAGKHHAGWDETTCRAMVLAGLDWFDQHPNATPVYSEVPGMTGLFQPLNQDATDLLFHIVGITGAERVPSDILHLVTAHILYAFHLGWEEYCRQSRDAYAESPTR